MKLSLKLALLNIRRYPLRTIGSAVCLLVFSFAMFSAALFTSSLSGAVSDILKTRSSGNIIIIKTDIDELDNVSKCPYILEALPDYWGDYVSGYINIEDIGEFDINFYYAASPDKNTLIPITYLDEFYAIGYENFLVAGRLPESSGDMIICESWLKKTQFRDYSVILDKPITIYHDWIFDEKIIDIENARIVGVFSEDMMKLNALDGHDDWFDYAFLLDAESEYSSIKTFCSIDQIDKAYKYFSEKYGKDKLIKTVLTTYAIERLSGLRLFIGNLMFLAAGAVALVYMLIQLTVFANYIKEKSTFVTAADAFGCGKKHIFGAFAAENIALLIPISVISALAGSAFVRMILELISAYSGVTLEISLNYFIIFAAAAALILIELVILLLSVLLFRTRSND